MNPSDLIKPLVALYLALVTLSILLLEYISSLRKAKKDRSRAEFMDKQERFYNGHRH